MSKTKLIFDLMMYVNAKRNFTAQDVAYEFDISVRTAHRYLMELSELGVPLYAEQGRNGGYRVLNNRVLPPVLFDEDEAFAIFFSFQSLKHYPSLPFDINVESAARKLHANLPEDLKSKVDRLESVLSFWNPKRIVSSPYLKKIIEAALNGQSVIMEYASKTGNKSKEVAPIGVYANDGLWYMPAFDTEHDAVRLFRADRILALEISGIASPVPMSLEDWLHHRTIRTPVRLHVKLTREGLRQCQKEHWLAPYIQTAHPEGEYVAYADMLMDDSETGFAADYFFRLGTDAFVLEPKEIVKDIRGRALRLIEHYGHSS